MAAATVILNLTLVALLPEEHDLNDIELIAQDLIEPLGIASARQVDLQIVRALIVPQERARLGEFREQAHHFVPAGEVLVQVAEIGPQVEQIGLLVEEGRAIQYQRQVDGHRQHQRRQAEDQEKEQDQGAELHVGDRPLRRLRFTPKPS